MRRTWRAGFGLLRRYAAAQRLRAHTLLGILRHGIQRISSRVDDVTAPTHQLTTSEVSSDGPIRDLKREMHVMTQNVNIGYVSKMMDCVTR